MKLNNVKYDTDVLFKTFSGPKQDAPKGASKRFEWTLSDEALQALVDIIPHPDDTPRETWIDVLHGIMGAGGTFEMWDSYAARWRGYDAADTKERWDTAVPGNVRSGGGLLRRMAEEADPSAFHSWKQKYETPTRFPDDEEASGGLPKAQQLKYAERIAAQWGGSMRYVLDRKAWAEFDGVIWRHLPSGVKLAGQRAMEMAASAPPRDKGEQDVTTLSFLDGVEGLCRQIPELQCRETDFDVDPWLLGTPGGVVDLRTGVLRDATAVDMVSKCCAVTPSPKAFCPRWDKFVREVTLGDGESATFLQQYAGYGLTGLTKEQKILFLYGPGGNGKSVFADMLSWVMGVKDGYAAKPVADLFIKKAHGMGHTSKLAMLAGARLCTISEVPSGAQWDEGLLKDITGGGMVTASFKHKDEFTFLPAFKLLAYGNHQPTFPGGIDEAIRRRFMLMEFKFSTATPDLDLMEKLKKEGAGILRWMIDGCLSWQETELMKPEKVRAATDAMFRDQDLVEQWMEARIERSKGHTIGATELFNDWLEWRNEQGNHELLNTQTLFGREMTDRRGITKRRSNIVRGYQDIKFRAKATTAFDDLDD